jgi:UDP-N-acetylglucosamine--N-acetylmuramyl-(pentapeptide) pyrophosphoryl-undecaprenol N-acetylglucosamine transferase
MKFRVLLVGGGTGGHVYPLMAVAGALRKKSVEGGVDLELRVIGEGKFLSNACAENGLKLNTILAGKMRRYFSLLNILDFFKIPIGFIQSLWHILIYMPDVVFAKGGYASFAPCLVAKLYRIPLYIHDSDSTAGLTNKIVGKLADVVLIAFKNAEVEFGTSKCILVGNPIRSELLGAMHDESVSAFKLDPNLKTILFLGGSQGARTINTTVLQLLVMLVEKYQIIHQCGDSQLSVVKNELEKIIKEGKDEYADKISKNYRLYPFFGVSEMRAAYGAADVIVSRAGAANIFEIAAIGKPAIVIPLTHSASNHQVLNAEEFSKSGAIVIKEDNLSAHLIINQIDRLLEPVNYINVSAQIKSFAMMDAADRVASQILSVSSSDIG